MEHYEINMSENNWAVIGLASSFMYTFNFLNAVGQFLVGLVSMLVISLAVAALPLGLTTGPYLVLKYNPNECCVLIFAEVILLTACVFAKWILFA